MQTITAPQVLAQITHYAQLVNDPLGGLSEASRAEVRELLGEATDLTAQGELGQARHVLDTAWQLLEG